MSFDQTPLPSTFRIDVSAEAGTDVPVSTERVMVEMLRQLVAGQNQQNRLLGELVQQNVAAQKQRAGELQQWKDTHPDLAKACRRAADTLGQVQAQFLESLTEEIADTEEHLVEGEYVMNEFVDRFGPRLAHLNGVLQVLAQLSHQDPPPKNPR